MLITDSEIQEIVETAETAQEARKVLSDASVEIAAALCEMASSAFGESTELGRGYAIRYLRTNVGIAGPYLVNEHNSCLENPIGFTGYAHGDFKAPINKKNIGEVAAFLDDIEDGLFQEVSALIKARVVDQAKRASEMAKAL